MDLAKRPGNSNVSDVALGLQAFEACRWQDAARYLRPTVSATDFQPEIAAKLAFACSQLREYEEARALLERLHRSQPHMARWPYMVGYQYYMQEAWPQAIEWFDRALAVKPGYVKALYRKGYAQFRLGRTDEAIKTLRATIDRWRELPGDLQHAERKTFGKASFILGKAYLSRGLSLKAQPHLGEAVAIDDADPDRHYELGKCLLKNGKIDESVATLSRADEIKPQTDYIVDRLAQAFAAKGEIERAKELYLSIPPNRRRAFILKNFGAILLRLNETDEAISVLRLAAAKDSNNHTIQHLLGQALEERGEASSALMAYRRAIELRRRNYNLDFPDAKGRLDDLEQKVGSQREHTRLSERIGVIEQYNAARGFGFIAADSPARTFFHISAFEGNENPAVGAQVSFEVEESPKGPRARKVVLLA